MCFMSLNESETMWVEFLLKCLVLIIKRTLGKRNPSRAGMNDDEEVFN